MEQRRFQEIESRLGVGGCQQALAKFGGESAPHLGQRNMQPVQFLGREAEERKRSAGAKMPPDQRWDCCGSNAVSQTNCVIAHTNSGVGVWWSQIIWFFIGA